MDWDQASLRARQKAYELLASLDLTEHEREEVKSIYMRLLKSLNDYKAFWARVDDSTTRLEILPSGCAMLTAYLDELVTAVRTEDGPPKEPGADRLRP